MTSGSDKVLDQYPNYSISREGAVTNKKGRIISQQKGNSGYFRVELWSGGKGKKFLVHRLLAEQYIINPKPLEYNQVNHINGVKTDNRLSNLEWTNQSENQKHAYRLGLQRGYKKPTPLSEGHKKALRGSRWKYEKHYYLIEGKTFTTCKEAGIYLGVNRQTVLDRCKSNKWPNWVKEVHYAK